MHLHSAQPRPDIRMCLGLDHFQLPWSLTPCCDHRHYFSPEILQCTPRSSCFHSGFLQGFSYPISPFLKTLMASQLRMQLEVSPWPVRPGAILPLATCLISSPALSTADTLASFFSSRPGMSVALAFSWRVSACNFLLNVCVASLLPHSVLGSNVMPSERPSLTTVSEVAAPPNPHLLPLSHFPHNT